MEGMWETVGCAIWSYCKALLWLSRVLTPRSHLSLTRVCGDTTSPFSSVSISIKYQYGVRSY